MAEIVQRTFGEGEKKGLVLDNTEFVRPLICGSDWHMLRIGFSYAITGNGTSNITGHSWEVGLCSGNIQGTTYNSSNTKNAIGVLLNTSSTITLTYNANSGNPYYRQSSNRSYAFKRTGSTTSTTAYATSGGIPYMPTTGGAVQRSGMIAVDIFRNTALGGDVNNWRVACGCTMDATWASNYVTHEMLAMHQAIYGGRMPADAIGSGLQWTTIANIPGAGGNEENDGYLNCVSIFYGPAGFPIEIYDLIVYRLR